MDQMILRDSIRMSALLYADDDLILSLAFIEDPSLLSPEIRPWS